MDRRDLIRKYKQRPPPAGVYRIRNTVSGRSVVGPSPNLPGMLNRQRFQLRHGSHPDQELQSDWNALGPDAFAFQILDQLEPPDQPVDDPSEELRVLALMWIDRLRASDEPLYPLSERMVRALAGADTKGPCN